jgi:hypothetical protein
MKSIVPAVVVRASQSLTQLLELHLVHLHRFTFSLKQRVELLLHLTSSCLRRRQPLIDLGIISVPSCQRLTSLLGLLLCCGEELTIYSFEIFLTATEEHHRRRRPRGGGGLERRGGENDGFFCLNGCDEKIKQRSIDATQVRSLVREGCGRWRWDWIV